MQAKHIARGACMPRELKHSNISVCNRQRTPDRYISRLFARRGEHTNGNLRLSSGLKSITVEHWIQTWFYSV